MARALMGHVGSSNETVLAYEVARLRRRVAELEAELATARDREHAAGTLEAETLEIELHRLAESPEPALA